MCPQNVGHSATGRFGLSDYKANGNRWLSKSNVHQEFNMKTIILAGGLGTRLAEETHVKPKPMVEIGGKPILWHIMKIYGSQGFNEFYTALGYKSEVIKDFFANYYQKLFSKHFQKIRKDTSITLFFIDCVLSLWERIP